MKSRAFSVGVPALLLALLLGLPVLSGPPGSPSVPSSGPVGSSPLAPLPAGSSLSVMPRLAPAGVGAIPPLNGSPGIRNVMVGVPCNATSANAEVVQSYDPAVQVLYELWIGCGGIGFSRSIDGGYSFQPAFAVPGSLAGSSWDPALALAPNGTLYAAFMLNNGSGDTPAVAWSFDHGQTFAGWAPIYPASPTEFSDRDYIAVAPNGTIYVSWDLSPNASLNQVGCAPGGSCYFLAGDYNIVVEWSTDGGHTWSAPVPVEPEYPNAAAPAGPLLVEPNGTIDLLYEDYPTTGTAHWLGVGRNYFVRSVDGGVHWSLPVAVENGTFSNNTWWIDGSLSRDSSGTLYAGFDTQDSSGDTAFVALSRDDGASWSAPIRLNPDTNGAMHSLVAVAGGENGTAYVAWMANNSTAGWSTYAATLFGNGTTLTSPTLVSQEFGVPGYWIGDTIGLSDLGGGRVAVSWTYGINQSGVVSSQIFAGVLGETAPADAPRITSVLPAQGSVSLGWLPPVGSNDWVGGYLLIWGLEHQLSFYNETLPGSASFTTVADLPPFLHWYFEVAATNGAGVGPFSAPVYVTLTNWGVLRGNVTPADAFVWVDNSPVPTSNGSYEANTSAGPHVLEVVSSGYLPFFTTVVLPWNGTTYQNATLLEVPATLEGWVHPIDASVTVDGFGVNTTVSGFFELTNLTSGRHALTVARHGFVTFGENLTLARNTTSWANVTLTAANGTLTLVVTPVTALVLVAGASVALDATGTANVSLAPGRYAIQVSASGYYPAFANASITSLSIVPLSLSLNPIPPPNPGNGTPPSMLFVPGAALVVIAGVLVAAVVAAALFLRGRRRRGDEEPASGSEESPALWESDEEPEPTGPSVPPSGP